VDSALGTFHFDKQPEILCTEQNWGKGQIKLGARQLSHSCGASSPQVLQPYFQPTEPSKQLQRIQATYVVQCALPFCMT